MVVGGTREHTVVATLLSPEERSRVETAAGRYFLALHATTVREARQVIRERSVCAVLVSAHRANHPDLSGIEKLVRDFPAVPAIVLVSRPDPESALRLLSLGASGVRRLVDVSRRDGWQRLREVIEETSPVRTAVLSRLLPSLHGVPEPTRRTFETMVWLAPGTPTVRALTRRIGVSPSTFMSRFFRAGLPSPKRYLSAIRLLHAAALFETPGFSISDVAYRLEYSSPQSFGRHVRAGVGLTAGEFRHRYPFDHALDQFMAELIEPFQAQLRTFRPL